MEEARWPLAGRGAEMSWGRVKGEGGGSWAGEDGGQVQNSPFLFLFYFLDLIWKFLEGVLERISGRILGIILVEKIWIN